MSQRASLLALLLIPTTLAAQPPAETPRAHDPRLVVELVAAAPDIVHPIGLDFDSKGRLLVIESHTHFPPKGYKGPPHDRVRILEDTDGNGKADRFSTFFEGTKATMDIATHHDGSIYLATRNEILRLRERNGKVEKERIVFLDTKGDYPHNGLSGLCFDFRGDLYFGMGENLGAPYKLTGSDGGTIRDEGEGGNIFWCQADGKKLRRVATGFWNPFGICRDIYGRMFTVDNDPDAMPPCRLLHVVEGGDYGYQFRYGRSGRHPFQSWNGQVPGTLPMMSGTGEAPCEITSYESDGLPKEYLGSLLVASWADHRIERYEPKAQGSSFTAKRLPFVTGGKDFRPVGIAVAPDGSLYISDWVKSDYTLHGKGAIWRVRWKDAPKSQRPTDPHQGLFSLHRPLREASARALTRTGEGRAFFRQQIARDNPRVRAISLMSLLQFSNPGPIDLERLAQTDAETGIRALALRPWIASLNPTYWLDARHAGELRRTAVAGLRDKADVPLLLSLLKDSDPFLRQAAVEQLSHERELLTSLDVVEQKVAAVRIGLLLAHRASGQDESRKHLPRFLTDPDEEVRFLAVKWIADYKLTDQRPAIVEMLKDRKLSVRLFLACSTALARIDGREVSDARLADYFLDRLNDAQASAELRVRALQLVPVTHAKLNVDLLGRLLEQGDTTLKLEAVRALVDHPSQKRRPLLLAVAQDAKLPLALRAQAIAGLADFAPQHPVELRRFILSPEPALRDEALRALADSKFTREQLDELRKLTPDAAPAFAALLSRILGQPFVKERPKADDTKAWLTRLEGPADAEAGRRVVFHSKLAACSRCHRVDGRGQDIGPDLSGIGRTERRHILESILQPSNLVAPHYQAWVMELHNGRVLTGMLLKTYLDEYTYLDANGATFKLNTRDIAETRPARDSIMPANLVERLTDQELRDLLAYLETRK